MKTNALTNAVVDMAALAQGAEIGLALAQMKAARVRAAAEVLVLRLLAAEVDPATPIVVAKRRLSPVDGRKPESDGGFYASPLRVPGSCRRHPEVSLDAQEGEAKRSLRDGLASEEATPDERPQGEERTETVRRAVRTLPEELRQPLILSVYEELPQAEIAAITARKALPA